MDPTDVPPTRDGHIVVVGGGIAGLVAALTCAKVGLRVTLLEASGRLGGTVRRADLGGLSLDVGVDGYATRGGHVRALLEELHLGDGIVTPTNAPTWIAGLPGGVAAPQPGGGVLGIPENPFADDVRRVLGWSGAWRAYLDRLRPPLTIGAEHSLGTLVRKRMGAAVLDRLVAPTTTGIFGAEPDDIDVDLAAPGLNAALTRAGSLSGAVGILSADTAGGPGFEGLAGGMSRLVDALARRLEALEAVVRTGVRVESIARTDRGWLVSVDPARAEVEDPSGEGDVAIAADAVIVATDEAEALRVLAGLVPGDGAASRPVEVVTLVVDAAALDAQPRGSAVLTVPGSSAATRLIHATAKWADLAPDAPHRHVVRVFFGGPTEPPATELLDDAQATALALSEASALLGVVLEPATVIAADRAAFVLAPPAAERGRADRTAAVRAALRQQTGIAAVGAWLAGSGLAQVVPDAAAEADRVRRATLWGKA